MSSGDMDGDGRREATEPGVTGATIILAGTSTAGQQIYYVSQTALDGSYQLRRPPRRDIRHRRDVAERNRPDPGDREDVAGQGIAGSLGGTAGDRLITGITLPDSATGTDYDFAEAATSGIAGTVYLDANKNGAR